MTGGHLEDRETDFSRRGAGMSDTGKHIMAAAARNLIPVSMELGGKSANVVFADADLELALEGSLRAVFSNNGAMCLAGSRLLVQRSILHEFTERYVAGAAAMRVGDPRDATVAIGPLIEAAHLQKVRSYVELGLAEGGELLTGGEPLDSATGLHFPAPGGALKPGYEAYKYPIVVRRRGHGVYVWGRVRPGKGIRYVQLERRSGSSFVKDGPEIDTNFSGYFKVNRNRRASYRFQYVTGIGGTAIGTSRTASPIK